MSAMPVDFRSFMSDSWMAWKPRIDEPSNIWPSVKKSRVREGAGTLKCCMTPGRSQKRTSTNLTFSFLMNVRTSSGLLNIQPPVCGARAHRGQAGFCIGTDPSGAGLLCRCLLYTSDAADDVL